MIAGLLTALALAFLLGLRHATDPDHLTAVSTLVLGGDRAGARRASRLGLAWGIGHATTLLAAGLPVVLARAALPETLQHATELGIGVIIVALAVRLLLRCRRSTFGVRAQHAALGRSPRAAYGIGLVHGLGGSAAVGLLLIAATPGRAAAVAALVVFAGGTAVSMSAASAVWGLLLGSSAAERRLDSFAPALGVVSLAFGAWYGAAAIG